MKNTNFYILLFLLFLLFSSNSFIQAQSGFSGYPFNPSIDVDGAISTHNTDTTAHSDLRVVDVSSHTDAAVILTAADCEGDIHYNGDNDVIDFTLPGAAEGLVCCFDAGGFDRVITVDVADGVDTFLLNGDALPAGYAIDTGGDGGEKFCVQAKDSTYWTVINGTASIANGGAD